MVNIQPLPVDILAKGIDKLPERDRDFAASLIDAHRRFGAVTAKQRQWIETLAGRVKLADLDRFIPLSEITKLFHVATTNGMKRPAIVFTHEGEKYRLSKAPENGRNAGHIYVKTKEYLGKIAPNGAFSWAAMLAPDEVQATLKALRAFAKDPVGIAQEFARETGCCSFCAQTLTDKRSVSAGYGPICAQHYGLPWGDE
jgi:hypothetical protein